MRHLLVSVVCGALALSCGGGGGGGGSACPPGEVSAGGGCVPEALAEGALVTPGLDEVVVEPDGVLWVRGALLVLVAPGTAPEAVAALAEARGGTVAGSLPGAGLYQLRFPVEGGEALDDLADGLLAEAGVEAAMRDLGVPGGLEAARDATDLETVAPTLELASYGDTASVFAPKTPAEGAAVHAAYSAIFVPEAWQAVYQYNPPLTKVVVGVIDGEVRHEGIFDVPFAGTVDVRIVDPNNPGGDPDVNTSLLNRRHGTAVASIIGAPNDGKGMNGILSGLKCVPFDLVPAPFVVAHKAFGVDELRGTLSGSIMAAVYAVRARARVVNMSWGLSKALVAKAGPKVRWDSLLRIYGALYGAAPGVLFVAAAGNEGADAAETLPCAVAATVKNVLCVGAADAGAKSVFPGGGATNFNAAPGGPVSLAAPGNKVLATLPNQNVAYFAGTSASAPLVSGTAALMFAVDPTLDGKGARSLLETTGGGTVDGLGRTLNASAAVLATIQRLEPAKLGTGTCSNSLTVTLRNASAEAHVHFELTAPTPLAGPSVDAGTSATMTIDGVKAGDALTFAAKKPSDFGPVSAGSVTCTLGPAPTAPTVTYSGTLSCSGF